MKTKYFTISGLILSAVLSAIVMSGCCSSCKSGKTSLCDTIDPNSATVIPVSKSDEWWTTRQAAINERVKQGNVDIIFFGDSITHGWEGYPQLWQQYFGKWQTINAGFSGDRTQNVIWRIENGGLASISPKLCVILIGVNNWNSNSVEEIADGIKTIVCKLRTELPQSKILLLAIFPHGASPAEASRIKCAQVSLLASEIADNKMVYYMDINDKFLDKDGILSTDIMPDLLHPKEKGYKIWGDAITPKIEELMAK
jgi:beta-glucosidase